MVRVAPIHIGCFVSFTWPVETARASRSGHVHKCREYASLSQTSIGPPPTSNLSQLSNQPKPLIRVGDLELFNPFVNRSHPGACTTPRKLSPHGRRRKTPTLFDPIPLCHSADLQHRQYARLATLSVGSSSWERETEPECGPCLRDKGPWAAASILQAVQSS